MSNARARSLFSATSFEGVEFTKNNVVGYRIAAIARLPAMRIVLLIVLLPLALPSWAANHYVRIGAGGANNGSDWTNAFTSIPSGTRMVRGDTYYLAAGSYGAYTFNTAESGTSVITIKAATIADHGTSTGWSNTYSVNGAGQQAVFVNHAGAIVFRIGTNYLTLDGNGTGLGAGCSGTDCGIKIDGTQCITLCWNIEGSGRTGITLRYLEVQGNGFQSSAPYDENFRFVGVSPGKGCQTCTIQHIYAHDSSSCFIQTQYAKNFTVEYSKFYNNNGNIPANHGAAWCADGDNTVTVRYNIFQDIEGTAVYEEGVNHIGSSDISVYANVFVITVGNPNAKSGVDNGIFAQTGASSCTNFHFYNNSIINYINLSNTIGDAVYLDPSGASTGMIVNNLWYQNSNNATFAVPARGVTVDYNTFLNTANNDSGIHSFSNGSATDPFVDWSNGNFHLLSETADAHLNDGLALSSPYNLDPDGIVRAEDGTWERGAYERMSPPMSPTDLRAVTK